MNDNSISTLTVNQFTDLMLGLLAQNSTLKSAKSLLQSLEPPNETDVKCIAWVSENCNLKPSTIRSMVSRGTIPFLTRKKPLQFSQKTITEWMTNGRPKTPLLLDFTPKRKKIK